MAMMRLQENDRSLPMVATIMRDAMYIALEARDAAMTTCDSHDSLRRRDTARGSVTTPQEW